MVVAIPPMALADANLLSSPHQIVTPFILEKLEEILEHWKHILIGL